MPKTKTKLRYFVCRIGGGLHDLDLVDDYGLETQALRAAKQEASGSQDVIVVPGYKARYEVSPE